MHAINILTERREPLCYLARGPKEIELYVNMVYRDCSSIVNIIPLNHLQYSRSNYFHMFFLTSESDELQEVVIDYYDLDKYYSKDITIVRIIPKDVH